ncbi:MAG: glycoside hydrolase family 57 protein [Armatimonadota bacterium]
MSTARRLTRNYTCAILLTSSKEQFVSKNFALVLHSHIPYVISHGRWPHGTDWLHEATAETYLPLLDALYRLAEEGHSPRITVGITPVLAEQLADRSFVHEFAAYLTMKERASAENAREFPLADYWANFYARSRESFARYRRSILGAWRELQDAGHVEIITSSATHGYSPLLLTDESLRAQVEQGVRTYELHFGRKPRGYWLPECAYRPAGEWTSPVGGEPRARGGVEEFLRDAGIEYFFVESHLASGGKTRKVYGKRFGSRSELLFEEPESITQSVYRLEGEPVYAFVRDQVTGRQVWNRAGGYPGEPQYLEFHKKHPPGGLRYWRVTGADAGLGEKSIYDPEAAARRVAEHAEHFVRLVREQPGELVCAPYDTELFGHWWFEGVDWLYAVLKGLSDDPEVRPVTCSEYLAENPDHDEIKLPEGSWGEGGSHYMWLNEETAWTWPLVHDAELTMREIAQLPGCPEVLAQAARELFLLQASDWQFCISTRDSEEYGRLRLLKHYQTFHRLARLARDLSAGCADPGDWAFFKVCEEQDNLFPDADPSIFAPS